MSKTIEVPRPARHPVDEILPVPKLAIYGIPARAGVLRRRGDRADPAGQRDRADPEQLIHLINADLFTCGIASIIQSVGFWKVGVRLPLLQGVTFTAVSPMIAIGAGQRRRHRGAAGTSTAR